MNNTEIPKGGPGVCPYCNEWHNNVSYHQVHDCPKSQDVLENRYLENLDQKTNAQTFTEFLNDVKNDKELKQFVLSLFNQEKEQTLNEVFDEYLESLNQEKPSQHKCTYDCDGGSCKKCGKSLSESLFEGLSKSPIVAQEKLTKPVPPKDELSKAFDEFFTEENVVPPEPKGLVIHCSSCEKQITQPGALLFSPPYKNQNITEKYHLCMECYQLVCDVLGIDFNFPSGGQD